jgi:flagellar protein FlgJ
MSNPNTISFSLRSSLKNMAEYASLKSTYDLIVARVTFVLLDDSNKEKFDRMGGWKSIGAIECIPFINFNDPTSDPIIAKPINSNISKFPLENELVTLRTLVSKEAQNNLGNYKPEIYYTDIISVFNSPEDNAAPDVSFFRLNPNSKSVTGNYISTGDNKRLLKAPGDITIEGRRGSSIRFGSNAANFNTPWQSSKPNPILILSNNPAKVSGSVARFEDVNKDGTVLVMMSGHNINFQAASNNFDSYNQTVVLPEAKNNIVVVDQVPKSKPTESLQQEDAKPIPVETLPTGSIPVSNLIPPPKISNAVEDEEELPEREDLMTINLILEETIAFPSSVMLDPPDDNDNTANTGTSTTTTVGNTTTSTITGTTTGSSGNKARAPITKNRAKANTNKRVADYINRYYDYAVSAGTEFDFDPIIMLAQGAMESGWGTSRMSNQANNFFGITAFGKTNDYWKGEIYQQTTNLKLKFRVYNTPDLSFKDFGRLIKAKYKTAYSNRNDYKAYAKSIANSSYIDPNGGDNREVYEKVIISNYEKIYEALK